jgi:PKD repeat protein
MPNRISSLDSQYQSGDLSLFPEAIDDMDTLYTAKNNAETKLTQSLGYNGKHVIVEDGSSFAPFGLIRVGPAAGTPGTHELIYYGTKNGNVFTNLVRGFAGSRQNSFNAGAHVSSSVMAEHHNAVKDAMLNIQHRLGTKKFPDANSIHGLLKRLENKYLAPRVFFKSYPRIGQPPLTVRFQNFSEGDAIRFFWDFGDGITSVERNPTHVYQNEGVYTVKLDILTTAGARGTATKNNYITVSEKEVTPFLYVVPANPLAPNYSVATAAAVGGPAEPQRFIFVDQSDGKIVQRFWVFDDGNNETTLDPDIHSTSHIYQESGVYNPSLIVVFSDQAVKRGFLTESITVL